jgi:REP element-mobilizing transposase RayT
MARPLRLEFEGAVYHITSRGNARHDIVADDEDRRMFLKLLGHVVDRYGWRCHAYCLMDNHYHVLIETPQPNLSRGMRQLNGRYTQAYNRRHCRVGHLLQGRFKAILVEKEVHLLELCRYVVLNPVRAKLVAHPRRWRWSSYRETGGETDAPGWLTTEWVLEQFGQRRRNAQAKYRSFVAEGIGEACPWDQVQGQIYLGGEEFIARHQPGRRLREIPRRQTHAHRPSLRALFQVGQSRKHVVYTAYRQHGYRLAEVATHLGVHYATVSRWLKQAEQRHV